VRQLWIAGARLPLFLSRCRKSGNSPLHALQGSYRCATNFRILTADRVLFPLFL
jgi:hypothetical protein